MKARITSPQNQKLLTNVAIIRLQKNGCRFEIACYPSTVLNWRSGVIKDISEVLQMRTVFSNVTKGVLANKKDLIQAFDTDDHETVCLEILKSGTLQVSGKERQVQLDSLFKDIATVVAEKCIDPQTKRPLTVNLVERAMHDIHYSVQPRRTAKQQALDVIRLLKESKLIQIERAPMKLQLQVNEPMDSPTVQTLKGALAVFITSVSLEEKGPPYVCEFSIDPSQFRVVDKVVRDNKGTLKLLDVGAVQGDSAIE